MSRPPNLNKEKDNGFPRVSGDEPGFRAESAAIIKFSPRERG